MNMKFLILFVSVLVPCYCDTEFSDRPRNFSIELIYFTQKHTDGHVVIAPFGIWTLMSGLTVGASGNCLKQLTTALILPKNLNVFLKCNKELQDSVLKSKDKGVTVTSENFMFLEENFLTRPTFVRIFQNEIGGTIKTIDFENPKDIANKFIKNSIGVETDVFRSDDFKNFGLILANTFTFKGLWLYQFNESETRIERFYDDNGRDIGSVNMMFQTGKFPYAELSDLKAAVLELPFGTDGTYSMLILLPGENVNVQDMYVNLSKSSLKDIFKILEGEDKDGYDLVDIKVSIPRFKISTNVLLNNPFYDMGLCDVFEPSFASFRGIVSRESVFVSAVVHTADIEVTESGLKTSAASSVEISARMIAPTFNANKPFVYFIIEKTTTTILVGGIYSKPTVY